MKELKCKCGYILADNNATISVKILGNASIYMDKIRDGYILKCPDCGLNHFYCIEELDD